MKIKSNMFNGKHTVFAVIFAIAFLGASITASAATLISNLRVNFRLYTNINNSSNAAYLNVLATSPSGLSNNIQLSTWNTYDTAGCQDFRFDVVHATIGGVEKDYYILYMRDNTSYVLSYNTVSTKPVMWLKDNNNPYTDYTLDVKPMSDGANTEIRFAYIGGQPYLIANGSQVTYGSQYGTRLNTSSSTSIGTNARWMQHD